jgi:hypothetical protein
MRVTHTPRIWLLLILTVTCLATLPSATQAVEYSMPVNGRFATHTITLEIPPAPKWAHDVVLNASLVWNKAQLWFQHTYFPDDEVYTFTESSPASVIISYALPAACVGIAVGWTDFTFAPSSSTIVSARTYLDSSVFNSAQENNVTAKEYAFRLALHELGRVLGLGNVIDGKDIMDPVGTPNRVSQAPMISILDLYAVHMLSSASSLKSSVVVLNTDQYQLLNAWSLLTNQSSEAEFVSSLASPRRFASLYGRSMDKSFNGTSNSRLYPSNNLIFESTRALLLIITGALLTFSIVLQLSQQSKMSSRTSWPNLLRPSNSHTY